MTTEQQIDRALSYFTDEEHVTSYELLEGRGHVLISAPHAVLQTRNGSIKCAERFTGMLCRLLHERTQRPVIYKSRHLYDDANHDPISDYRDAMCRYIKQHAIRCVLDLHQLSPERPMELCICTGKGKNLLGHAEMVEMMKHAFQEEGIRSITTDDPYDASNPHTVSSTVVHRCGVPCVQLDLNTRLLMTGYDDYCFMNVLHALESAATQMDAAL